MYCHIPMWLHLPCYPKLALTMLAEIGTCINYFSQNSQITCSKNLIAVGSPIFFYYAMKIYICISLKYTFNLLFLRKSYKCISKHLLFCLKIDLLVLTKCSFDFWFAFSKFIFLGLVSDEPHWCCLLTYLYIYFFIFLYIYLCWIYMYVLEMLMDTGVE